MTTTDATLVAVTDRGLLRARNQDAALARVEGARTLLVVADGMGGRPAGEIASALVIRAFEMESGAEPPTSYLRDRIEAARASIAADVGRRAERAGMGSTVVAALVEADNLWVAHVGDSRAYLWEEGVPMPTQGRLSRLTRDHSVAQLAIDAGTLTPLQALTDRRRAQLTRVVAAEPVACELLGPVRLPERWCLLLVSDGVCGVLPDEAIAPLVAEQQGLALAETLRAAVRVAGAPDNLAIALFDRR